MSLSRDMPLAMPVMPVSGREAVAGFGEVRWSAAT